MCIKQCRSVGAVLIDAMVIAVDRDSDLTSSCGFESMTSHHVI
jgi:hypothetical protein